MRREVAIGVAYGTDPKPWNGWLVAQSVRRLYGGFSPSSCSWILRTAR
ncbi:MAG: hypothetical protein ACLU6O_03730 [Bilophila wadsworthia]